MDIEFRYLYRDGGNYKKWGSVVFANPEKVAENVVGEAILRALLPHGLFISTQIRMPGNRPAKPYRWRICRRDCRAGATWLAGIRSLR
ncbi:MAG: hypothetical protein JWO91_809 [Acidobacteriaceae bacterium]|nr:hypothetical protein [Acidobacteriaceae bacterium]